VSDKAVEMENTSSGEKIGVETHPDISSFRGWEGKTQYTYPVVTRGSFPGGKEAGA
jgi:hypothetical protein